MGHASEPGYAFVTLPDVTIYRTAEDGADDHVTGGGEAAATTRADRVAIDEVKAYVMDETSFRAVAPSRRYAGLLYCAAEAELAPAYADQLACKLSALGHNFPRGTCEKEAFKPSNDPLWKAV